MSKPNSKHVVKEVRLGLIVARISEKRVQSELRYSVKLSRLYRNGDVWKESALLGRDDLPVAAKVLQMAHWWIYSSDK